MGQACPQTHSAKVAEPDLKTRSLRQRIETRRRGFFGSYMGAVGRAQSPFVPSVTSRPRVLMPSTHSAQQPERWPSVTHSQGSWVSDETADLPDVTGNCALGPEHEPGSSSEAPGPSTAQAESQAWRQVPQPPSRPDFGQMKPVSRSQDQGPTPSACVVIS